MNIKDQIDIAEDFLTNFKVSFGEMIVLGGAPRDWLMDKMASDIDVYIFGSYTQSAVIDLLEKSNIEYIWIEANSGKDANLDSFKEYEYNPNIRWVCKFFYKGQEFNLIFCRQNVSEKQMLDTFAFDICKAVYKVGGLLYGTREFIHAKANKSLKLVNELYMNGGKYAEKIYAKFPDWDKGEVC